MLIAHRRIPIHHPPAERLAVTANAVFVLATVVVGSVASSLLLTPSGQQLPATSPVHLSAMARIPLEAWTAEGLTATQVAAALAVDEDRLDEIARIESAAAEVLDKAQTLAHTQRVARASPGRTANREMLGTLYSQIQAAKSEHAAARSALLISIVANTSGCQAVRLQRSADCVAIGLPVWIGRSDANDDQLKRYASAKRSQARSARMGLELSQQASSTIYAVEQAPGVQDTRSWVESQRQDLAALAIIDDE